jgi:hypothetical protein
MGDTGAAISAALYVASNIYSWSEAKRMPKLQAEANKEVLRLQKEHYDAISKEQREILNAAIDFYLANVNDLLDSDEFENAYPDVPIAAEFVPVDACCVQGATIECNIDKTDRADVFARNVNRLHERNDLAHVLQFDPRFLVTLDIQSQSIQDLTRGILPVGDVVEVLTDNAERASLTGRIGNTRKTTARDLGISKLRAQTAGRAEFREATAWVNTAVSPQNRQVNLMEMMVNPTMRIQLALNQAQLIQQSLQNKNNALAQKEPFKMAELQMKIQRDIVRLQQKASEALLVNTHVPNFASIVPAPSMSNISGLVGSIGQAVSNVNLSHFFGAPPQDQTGYRGGFTGQEDSGYRHPSK